MESLKHTYRKTLAWALVLASVMLLLQGGSQQARAQYESRWIAIGSLHSRWSQVGMWSGKDFPDNASPLWDGIQKESGWGYGQRHWIGVANIRDLGGGPGPVWQRFRSRGSDVQRFWPKPPFRLVSRRPAPQVTVDRLPTFQRVQNIDEVDPSLPADRMMEATHGTWMGLDVQTRVYAYGAESHDDYYIIETTYTNTGNTDQDEDIEEDRTLEGVYVARYRKWAGFPRLGGEATWRAFRSGKGVDSDRTLASEPSPDHDVDFSSIYMWAGFQDNFTEWDTRGIPILRRTDNDVPPYDTTGRLASGGMPGYVHIYAPERGMGAEETPRSVPDAGAAQPHGTRHQWNQAPGVSGYAEFFGYDALEMGHIPEGWWQAQRECPREEYPGLTWEERMAQCNTNALRQGVRHYMSYGPYTLAPGEHITIVQAVAVSGLSYKAKHEIGRAYKRLWEQDRGNDPIEYDANGDGEITDAAVDGGEGDEVMSKNMWVMQSRDSLFQTFRNARAAWQEGLEVPDVAPPRSFSVTSQPDQVELVWTLYDDAPAPDSFAVYRTDVSYRLPHEHVATVAATEGQREYTYADTEVARGVGYFYHLQAIGKAETSLAGVTPAGTTLRSNRYWTQTYTPTQLVRGPGQALADARVVPNPLNVGADPTVRFPNQRNRIGFLNIPGQCTIRIYTELGELVRTLRHVSGSGDEYWNLTTRSNQVAQSGIYMAVIQDEETGEKIIRRFVIIR